MRGPSHRSRDAVRGPFPSLGRVHQEAVGCSPGFPAVLPYMYLGQGVGGRGPSSGGSGLGLRPGGCRSASSSSFFWAHSCFPPKGPVVSLAVPAGGARPQSEVAVAVALEALPGSWGPTAHSLWDPRRVEIHCCLTLKAAFDSFFSFRKSFRKRAPVKPALGTLAKALCFR